MIQRKQSVFLFLAVVIGIVCLCMPLCILKAANVGVDGTMFNLWLQNGNGGYSFIAAPLFAVLFIDTLLNLYTIFLYKNRKKQIRYCSLSMLLLVIWYLAYAAILAISTGDVYEGFRLQMATVLPLICLILVFMARKGIKADEALIRASERLR